MDVIVAVVNWLDKLLWGWPLIVLLLGTHIYMTIRTGFVQRYIFKGIRLSVTRDPDAEGDVTQFGALTTALASTIGTGNIIGVGTAIALGGPGAVLWTWFTGVFGIATKYSESLIAVKYRVKAADGSMIGGAMYALERGLKLKWLGVIFAILTSLCAFGIGCTVQANAVSVALKENFHISPWISGIVIAALVGLVILGGIQSITKVAEKLVPFMAVFYVLGCIIILCINHAYLGQTFYTIFHSAFTARAAGGGFIGSTIMLACRYGIARGLFSNESGLGSAPLVASAAQTRNPVRQALVSMTGTFWDTVIICAMTGLVLVSSIIANPNIDSTSGDGGILTSQAFDQIHVIGPIVLVFGLITFAFSTILGWFYYGERCMIYLFGTRVSIIYKILWVIVVFVGAGMELQFVWNLADLLNGLMAIPNLIAVLLLSGVIAREGNMYLKGDDILKKDQTPIPIIPNQDHGVLF